MVGTARVISRRLVAIVAAAGLAFGLSASGSAFAAPEDLPQKPAATVKHPIPPVKPSTAKTAPAGKPASPEKAASAKSGKKTPVATQPKPFEHGHVYLLRGLANIWSRGMDTFSEQLAANGVRWSISNHRKWRDLAAEAVEKYKADPSFGPIIIVGHSLGADASILMAQLIGMKGVPVRLIVTFDGVARQDEVVTKVSSNVAEVLNFYKSNGWGREMIPSKGFKGKIDNVDMQGNKDVGHLNIDKDPELQARVLALILDTLNEKPAKSARK